MKSCLVFIVLLLQWICCTSQNVCEEPPDIEFGEIVSDEKAKYLESDQVQYKCNTGYALEGPEWITCKGQKWTSLPKCLAPCGIAKEQLEAKNLFLPGGRRRSQIVQSNQMLQFMCREGYVLTPPSVRKCVDGHMDLPLCISESGRNCSHPPNIQNGDIITLSQKQYTSGSSVEFQCQRYYAIEGHNYSFCDNGNWTKVPVCLEPCAVSLAEMEGRNIEVKGRSDESGSQDMYVQRGNSVELTCKSGYAFATNSFQSAFLIQCDGKPIVYPECREITCNPPRVANGTFRPQRNVYQDGDLIQIECDSGIQVDEGRKIAECTRNGWSPPPECSHATCPPPPEVTNGQIDGQRKQHYLPLEKVRYRCRQGYSLFGSPTVTCLNKQWTEAPRCRDAAGRCGRPPPMENGDVVNIPKVEYMPGESVQYRCQNLYLMEGSPMVSCYNGHWSDMPRCLAPCTAYEQDMKRNNIMLKWVYGSKLYSESGHTTEFVCIRGYRKDPDSPPFRAACKDGKLEYPRCI